MEGSTVLIEISSLRYPLRLRGRVGQYEWQMFAKGDDWVFLVEDAWVGGCDCEQLWVLSAKYPDAEKMPQMVAIRIADACAKKFEKLLSTME